MIELRRIISGGEAEENPAHKFGFAVFKFRGLEKSRTIAKEIEVRGNFRPCKISRNGLLQIAAEFLLTKHIGRRAEGGLGDADEQADEGNTFVRDSVEIGDFRSAAEEFVQADE